MAALGFLGLVVLPLFQEVGGGLIPADFVENHKVEFWTTFGLVVALVGMLSWLKLRRSGSRDLPPGDTPLERAAGRMSKTVAEYWHDEAAKRGIGDHFELLPLRWNVRRPTEEAEPMVDAATLTESAVASYNASTGRMVILGEPGSGKTALAVMLTRGLVKAENTSAPVPALVSVSTWDPRKDKLETWIANRIADNHTYLRVTEQYGPSAPARLLDEGKIIPVLDGLDELPRELRPLAIRAIGRSTLDEFVLTCRSEDYAAASAAGGSVVRNATELHLDLLTADDTTLPFFRDYDERQRQRWVPVLDRLHSGIDPELTKAFDTPLIVSLARDVYQDPRNDPGELLNLARFPDAEELRKHILRSLVPTVFPTDLSEEEKSEPDGWDGVDADRWLRFLAHSLEKRGARDIRWWELPFLARRAEQWLAFLAGALIVGPPVGLGVGMVSAPLWGVAAGLLAAGLLGWCSMRTMPPPSELYFGLHASPAPLLSGLVVAVIGGGAGWVVEGSAGFGLVVGVVFGMTIGFGYGLARPDGTVRASDPRRLLWRDQQVALVFGVLYAITTGGVTAVAVGPVFGIGFGVACGLAGGLMYGPVWLLAFKTEKVGIIAWVHFALIRLLLVPGGKMPFRTMAFFEAAHDRGVLRQVGAIYQFRHVNLQKSLAAEQVG